MNERIRKLVKQAELPLLDVDGKCKYGDTYFSTEKFAELIVRECAEVCLAQRDPANLNYKPSEKFAEAVKEHFGVDK
jgi:hypothetical protein